VPVSLNVVFFVDFFIYLCSLKEDSVTLGSLHVVFFIDFIYIYIVAKQTVLRRKASTSSLL
jgi:hypothetical protein